MRPARNTYPDYYDLYIPLVQANNVVDALLQNQAAFQQFAAEIPATRHDAYAPGKWTVKQVINHLADTERIIAYRALRFGRKDFQQPLAFDENMYAANAELADRSLDDVFEELKTVREASLSLFRTFSPDTLLQSGHTTYGPCTVLALGYMIAGHAQHHMAVIRERYL